MEWFENEEMKGKEVDFQGLVVLNGLKVVQPPAPAAAAPAPAVAPPTAAAPASMASRERRNSPKAVRREVTNPPVPSQAAAPVQQKVQPGSARETVLGPGDRKRAEHDLSGICCRLLSRAKRYSPSRPAIQVRSCFTCVPDPSSQPWSADLKKNDKKIAIMIDECRAKMDIRPFPVNQEVCSRPAATCSSLLACLLACMCTYSLGWGRHAVVQRRSLPSLWL